MGTKIKTYLVLIIMCSVGQLFAQDYKNYATAVAHAFNEIVVFDPWVAEYTATLSASGEMGIYSNNKFCSYTHFTHFISRSNGQFDSTFLFEDPLFLNARQLDSCEHDIALKAKKMTFAEYLLADINSGYYVLLSKPTLTDSCCYVEVTLCNRLNPSRLHLMLIFNKRLHLIHIWRKATGYKTNFDLQFCTEEDTKAYFGYEYPNLFWEDSKLVPLNEQ
jgi:hypothetical protein